MEEQSAKNRETVPPMLSITLPVYNGEEYVQVFLDSILSQTFTNFELIISDNASTDGTSEILEKYAQKDSRIQIYYQEKTSTARDNCQFLLEKAKGKYFMWTACDDSYSPFFVETILSGMEKDPSIILGFAPYQNIDEKGSSLGNPIFVDNSGKTSLLRLLKFFWTYDDYIIYGIYRFDAIKGTVLPDWWSINQKSPYDIAYGYIPYVLAKGGYGLYGTEPLFYKLIKTKQHYQPFHERRKIFAFFFFNLFRRINLSWVEFVNIAKGSSLIIAIVFSPVIILRNAFEYLRMIRNIARKQIKIAVDSLSTIHSN